MPGNCIIFEAPKLNAEIKASFLEPLITRDKRIVEKQQKIAIFLAALGKLLAELLKSQTTDTPVHIPDTPAVINTLSDIGCILVGLQRDETITRRLIITANLNSSIKETLNATSTDEWLFGDKLENMLKSAKALERSSKDLKPILKASAGTSSKTPKNVKGPSRQTIRPRTNTGGGGEDNTKHTIRSSGIPHIGGQQRGGNTAITATTGNVDRNKGKYCWSLKNIYKQMGKFLFNQRNCKLDKRLCHPILI